MTPEEIETEYWACQAIENPEKESFEDDDFDIDEVLAEEDDWETLIDEKGP